MKPAGTVAVQARMAGSWLTIERAPVAVSGAYHAQLWEPGAYRVVYGGVDGPTVNVG